MRGPGKKKEKKKKKKKKKKKARHARPFAGGRCVGKLPDPAAMLFFVLPAIQGRVEDSRAWGRVDGRFVHITRRGAALDDIGVQLVPAIADDG